jgi:hypothetical protein
MFKSFAFVLLTFSSICLAGSGFEYGGLSLNSDPSTYKKRYPTSIVQGNSAWLSKADSHPSSVCCRIRSGALRSGGRTQGRHRRCIAVVNLHSGASTRGLRTERRRAVGVESIVCGRTSLGR